MKKLKKLYLEGGGPFPYAQAGEIAGSLFDSVTPTNSYGVKSNGAAMGASALKGAGKGAAMGTMILPGIGTAVGAGVGAIAGALAGRKKNEAAKDLQADAQALREKSIINTGLARLSSYDSTGANTNQIYAKMGGLIGDPPINPKPNPKTGITKFATMPVADSTSYMRNDPRLQTDPDLLYGRLAFEKNPKMQRVTLGNTADGLTNVLLTGYQNELPSSPGLNPYGAVATYTGGNQNVAIERKEFGGKLSTKYFNGGELKQLSSESVEVDGNSHANGGVNLGGGIEVEGQETIKDNFVFSDALGFAKLHKPIARAIGRMEAKPLNNITSNTIKLLKSKEEALKMKQESLKEQLGIKPMSEAAYGGFMNIGTYNRIRV